MSTALEPHVWETKWEHGFPREYPQNKSHYSFESESSSLTFMQYLWLMKRMRHIVVCAYFVGMCHQLSWPLEWKEIVRSPAKSVIRDVQWDTMHACCCWYCCCCCITASAAAAAAAAAAAVVVVVVVVVVRLRRRRRHCYTPRQTCSFLTPIRLLWEQIATNPDSGQSPWTK